MFGQLRSEHAKEFLLIAWSSAFKPLIQKSSHNVLDTGCIIVLQVPHVHITSAAQRCDEVFISVVLFVVLFGTTGQFHMIIWYIIICSHDNMVQLDFRNYKWVCPKIWYVSENPVVLSCFIMFYHVLSSFSPAKLPFPLVYAMLNMAGRSPQRPSPSRSCGASQHHLGATWQFAHWYLATEICRMGVIWCNVDGISWGLNGKNFIYGDCG